MDDDRTPHDELVNRMRPFVLRYVQAKPQVYVTWFSGHATLPQLEDIMADFWEWIRHGTAVELFTNSTHRDVAEAFEDVLHSMPNPSQEQS